MLRNRVPLLTYGDSITIGVKRKRGLFTGIKVESPSKQGLATTNKIMPCVGGRVQMFNLIIIPNHIHEIIHKFQTVVTA
ncbi:hypothetical protein Ahy_A09g041923 isoform D [Arachis hypogaea]|uniref:Uncharacterized protein n=1 Tax=Arachis hypogaea TaxID=3818 RepID=A0A445BE87_ARAHY|nr:hypothetical protein Ahy_A09g041923 isoform D [Arachis hypogaea]